MGDFFKKFSSGLFKHRANGSEDGSSFGQKNAQAAKDVAKNMAKEYGKKMLKKAITSKAAIFIGVIFGKIVIVVVSVVLILIPLSYAMMIYEGAMDTLNDVTLKASANVQKTWNSFFVSKTDYDRLDKVAKNYENFLFKRFEFLNNKILEENLTDGEADDAKMVAVEWVYSKIYNDFFKASSLLDTILNPFGDLNDLTKTPILKPISETATEIYTPIKGSNVEESRKNNFGDSINLYDIEAFDYVAGTLFDLMELDLAVARQEIIDDRQETIDKETEAALLSKSRQYTQSMLTEWANTFYSLINETNGAQKHLKDLGLDHKVIKQYGKSMSVHNLHTFMKDYYSYTSSEQYKWFIDALDKLDEDGCEKGNSTVKIAEGLIKNSSDIEKLSYVASEIENVYIAYIKSLGSTIEQQNKLSELTKEKLNNTPFKSKYTTYFEKYEKDIDSAKVEVIKTVTDDELNAKMKEIIEDLNLARTQQAAVTYRDYLTELEDVTTIKYYSFNMENDIFKTLYTIPQYTLDFFTEHANSKKDVDTLLSSDKYYKSLKPKIDGASSIKEQSFVKDNMFVDKSEKNPIVSGIDTSTGIDYLSSTKSLFVSELYNIVNDSIKELEDIKLVFDAAQNPNSEEYKQIVGKLEEYAWKDVEESYAAIKANPFFTFRLGITDYYGSGIYNERVEGYTAFEQDIANHTRNSEYWAGISAGVAAANNNRPTQYSPLPLPYVPNSGETKIHENEPPFSDFVKYMNDDTKTMSNDYLGVFLDYNALITTLSNNMNYIDLLNGAPTAEGKLSLNDFFDKATLLVSKEIEKLNAYKNELKVLETATIDNNPGGVLVASSIKKIFKHGEPLSRDDEYIINENELKVKKFKYTQEEAIKKTATTCFGDVLARFKNNNNSNKEGMVIDIGDLKIGENTVPTGESYAAYENSLQYLNIIQEVVSENHDLIDPYYLLAMIAAESGGNPQPYNGGGPGNVGIMQIGDANYNNPFTLPNGRTVIADPEKLAVDHKLCIEVGMAIALNNARSFEGNLFMGVVGYNMGEFAMQRIIFLTLVGQGKVDKNVWTTPGSTWHVGIKDANERKRVEQLMKDYMSSGDLDWLNYRKAYQEENWYNTGVGTAHHLERVLSFYNSAQGMPWYRPSKDSGKIIMGSASGSGTVSIGEDESGNKIYHKDKRLYLWKEYYTDNNVFKTADTWFSKNAENENEKAKLLSSTIIRQIDNIDTKFESSLNEIDMVPAEFKSIIAATLNVGTVAIVNGSTEQAIVCQPGFKISPTTLNNATNLINAVAKDYIDIYSSLNGKDKDFAIYIYLANDRELAKAEIANEKGSFVDFVKNKYKDDAEGFTSPESNLLKVAQVLTGDLNVNAKDFYNLIDNVSTDSDSNNNTLKNPIDEYYQQWLDAKYTMHEMYNTMIDDVNKERIKNGEPTYPLLPTYDEAVLNKNNQSSVSDIEGTLTVKGPNGEMYSVQIRKKFLEKQGDSIAKASYIVIHDTGDTGTNGEATKRFDIMNSDSATETMHYVVGSSDIYHMTENNKAANHINDSATSTGGTMPQVTNTNSLGVQFEASVTRNKDKVFWHTVAITKYLMDQNQITNYDNVILHNDVTGVQDSNIMLKNDKEEWIKFKEALKNSTVTFSVNTGNLSGTIYNLVETARSLLGQPYVYGAVGETVTDELITTLQAKYGATGEYEKTPRKFFDGTYRGFDCSSFVQYVYAQNGITLDRTTYAQMKQGTDVFKDGESIIESKLQPGDLLFSDGHVIMWIGNGEYIHASMPGDVIKIGKGIPSDIIKVKRFVESNGSFEFYSQHDSRWANFYYCGDNVAKSGCGPTATAMVLSGLKYTNSPKIDTNGDGKITPDELAAYSTAKGTFLIKEGTTGDFYTNVAAELNIPVKTIWAGGEKDVPAKLAELKAYLKAGKAIVASYQNGHWIPEANGHLVAFVGVDNNDKIIVHDPNLNSYEDVRGERFNGPNPDSYILGEGTGAYFFVIFG